MKEKYIKQVKKELRLPRKEKTEIIRDLYEIFASAVEHGETEQQVIERLGTPQEFAACTAEQFAADNLHQKRKNIIPSLTALAVAVIAFAIYVATKINAIDGAIGQADATTNIQIYGTFGFDFLQIILAIGLISVTFAVVQIVRALRIDKR